MELKDVIMSTLAEMEEVAPRQESSQFEIKEKIVLQKNTAILEKEEIIEEETVVESSHDNELVYLNSIRERLLVLFEGFQAPNNTNIEAKIDMTLNFLEYTLATIETRVELLEKGKR